MKTYTHHPLVRTAVRRYTKYDGNPFREGELVDPPRTLCMPVGEVATLLDTCEKPGIIPCRFVDVMQPWKEGLPDTRFGSCARFRAGALC